MSTPIPLLFRLLSYCPLRILHGLGAVIGLLFYLIPNKRRSTTFTNLAICFPELSSKQRRRLARKVHIETGKGLIETSVLWFRSKQKLLPLVKQTSGLDILQSALQNKTGVILTAPHLGGWEIIGLYASINFQITILYKSAADKKIDGMIRNARQRLGAQLVPTDSSGIRALFKTLSKGAMIGILPDQDPAAGGGTFVPFFKLQTNTMVLLPRLAAKSKAAVIFSYAERLKKGRGYHLHFIPCSEKINDDNLKNSAAEMNRMVEQCIRRIPEQYLWCYKRFRTRPTGENKIYLK